MCALYYKNNCPKLPLSPEPVQICWGTWLEAGMNPGSKGDIFSGNILWSCEEECCRSFEILLSCLCRGFQREFLFFYEKKKIDYVKLGCIILFCTLIFYYFLVLLHKNFFVGFFSDKNCGFGGGGGDFFTTLAPLHTWEKYLLKK